jgi:prepilin-type N-terminal cleavage/methylation domain-containing protein
MLNSRHSARSESGFSLVELLVAMVVTTIITGAIYGMMRVGQNAFQKEPELVDRQDNIRMAMNLIERDLMAAGSGMGPWTQVFTPGLDGNSAVVAPSGANADSLEFLAHSWDCRDLAVDCTGGCNSGANLKLLEPLAGAGTCYTTTRLVFVAWSDPTLSASTLGNGRWSGKWGVGVRVAGGGTGGNDAMSFPTGAGQPSSCGGSPVTMVCNGATAFGPPGGAAPLGTGPYTGTPNVLMPLSVIRYEIANDTDGTPTLFRSEVGGRTADGSGAYTQAPGGTTWQLVARGIEDLQVVYISRSNSGAANVAGAKVSNNSAPTISANVTAPADDYSNIVTEVRVTLGARTLAVASATGGTVMRGQLTRTVTIPAALAAFRSVPVGSVSYGNQWW